MQERKSSGDSFSQDRVELSKYLATVRKEAEESQMLTSLSQKHGPPPPADFSPDRGSSPATTPHAVPCGAVPAIGGPAAMLVKFGQSKLSVSAGGKVSFLLFALLLEFNIKLTFMFMILVVSLMVMVRCLILNNVLFILDKNFKSSCTSKTLFIG